MPTRVRRLSRRPQLVAAAIVLALCLGSGPAAASLTGAAAISPARFPGVTSNLVPGVTAGGVPGLNPIGAAVDAVFLGDSYTYGIGATVPSDSFAYLTSMAEHWTSEVIGLPGSGYTRVAKKDGLTIAAGIGMAIDAQPQVLIVECGRNDADPGVSVAKTRRNALQDLRALRAGLPNATMIVLGPVWLNGRPTAHALAVRDAVHAAQQKIAGSLWIDPIAEKWFTGRFVNRSGDDATMINYRVGHPDNLGYQHIAEQLEADLQTLGVA